MADNNPDIASYLASLATNSSQANQQLGSIIQVLQSIFPIGGATSSSATSGAATLPGNPLGFLAVTLPNGTAVKIPYYKP